MKVLFGIWGVMMLISLTLTGAVVYVVYTIITKPELLHKWISTVVGG
jgi:hypothetical protein